MDWNLIPALDALLAEASVSRAAARIGVTTPSMSRMLGRLRVQFGDPLLVRAGRGLVLTSHARALRDGVAAVAAQADALLVRESALARTARTLVIRANEALAAVWLVPLVAQVRARAPRVSLAFVSEGEERVDELRDGRVDLDVGVRGESAPELRTQAIGRDTFVALVRRGHPLLRGPRTAARLVQYPHVGIARRGKLTGPLDVALRARGLARDVVATVPSAVAAAHIVAATDWIVGMPALFAAALARQLPLASFAFPLAVPGVAIAQTWHPRLEADAIHRVLREEMVALVRGILRER